MHIKWCRIYHTAIINITTHVMNSTHSQNSHTPTHTSTANTYILEYRIELVQWPWNTRQAQTGSQLLHKNGHKNRLKIYECYVEDEMKWQLLAKKANWLHFNITYKHIILDQRLQISTYKHILIHIFACTYVNANVYIIFRLSQQKKQIINKAHIFLVL